MIFQQQQDTLQSNNQSQSQSQSQSNSSRSQSTIEQRIKAEAVLIYSSNLKELWINHFKGTSNQAIKLIDDGLIKNAIVFRKKKRRNHSK